MQNIAKVLEYQGKKYFAVKKGHKLLLSECFDVSFLSGCLKDCVGYEMTRNGSIIMSGDAYDSEYFRGVVFHVKYSELSRYRPYCNPPPRALEVRGFNVEDELLLDTAVSDGVVYDSIMGQIESRLSLYSVIDGSTQRFLDTCKRSGIHVSMSTTQRPVLLKEYPGNIYVVDYFAIW